MDQTTLINQLLRDHPEYSRLKRINLCDICEYGNIIPRYILCLRNNELNSGACVKCEDFTIDEDKLRNNQKCRCKLCIYSTYLEKSSSCSGLFCTHHSKAKNGCPVWISEVMANSCQEYKFEVFKS